MAARMQGLGAVQRFEARMQRAMDHVRVVLDTNRRPCFAADVHHQYQDKYVLAESMTNAAVASQANALASLGLTREQMDKMCSWAESSAVSLQFRSEELCTFLREESKDVESATKKVVEATGPAAMFGKLTSKTVTTVTEYFWKYQTSYELMVVRGVGENEDDRMRILQREGQVELKTNVKDSPHPSRQVHPNTQVNISWMVKQLRMEANHVVPAFTIDRASSECRTPMRNPEVNKATEYFNSLEAFAGKVAPYLERLLRVQPDPTRKLDLSALDVDSLFSPVLPLMEDKGSLSSEVGIAAAAAAATVDTNTLVACLIGAEDTSTNALGLVDTNAFLAEEARLLKEKHDNVMKSFPSGDAVATAAEAMLSVTLRHCASVCNYWTGALQYIEDMLRKQLIAAIGKEVTPADFADYMSFHNRKLFADAYAPTPFCFAVRRSERHSPEGTLSIEQEAMGGDSNIAAPIVTLVARSSREHRMEFALSASANVSFGGDKFLHAWLSHKFSGQPGPELRLVSKTRQFSGFIVLVGRIASPHTFDPKYAAIVQNKDELSIPLDLSTIPTPKEFKDAIESLSPQQQAFAKAFRSMQLESTLFGILVIQIKPQLEKVLNLPYDSLTKEIKLTQDLMQLFVKYQIPSDLLAFDPDSVAEGILTGGGRAMEKVAAVKESVKAMQEMIKQSQQEEVEESRMEYRYAHPVLETNSDCSPQSDYEERLDCDLSFGMQMECAVENIAECRSAPAPELKRMSSFSRGVKSAAASVFKSRSAAPAATCAAPVMASAAVPAASAAAPPQQPQQQQQQAQEQQQQRPHQEDQDQVETTGRDYTQVPKEMDENFERLDTDSQLRPTIITPSGSWSKRSQKALLASPTTDILDTDSQKKEKDAAFDLLDALTKSGALPIEHASLHIVVAATHCFDKAVTETVVQDNINPIEKVERSTLIMASTVHQQPASALIRDAQLPRVKAASPMLFLDDKEAADIS